MIVIGQHSTSPWSPLPCEHRGISPTTKQAILHAVARKDTARKIRGQLNIAAKGINITLCLGVVVDDRNQVPDRGIVPEQKKIQQVCIEMRDFVL